MMQYHSPYWMLPLGLLAAVSALECSSSADTERPPSPAADGQLPVPRRAPEATNVRTHSPQALTAISTQAENARGQTAGIPCATCHAMRDEPHELPQSAAALKGPHEGLQFEHGALDCASCHSQTRYDQLHLANGEGVALDDAMKLCVQCHGTQARDYEHGAHGGMRGYWDTDEGPRMRNHCTDCHDPHQPAFPSYEPVLPPRDRFLDSHGGAHE